MYWLPDMDEKAMMHLKLQLSKAFEYIDLLVEAHYCASTFF
jgi:hypothetical protein